MTKHRPNCHNKTYIRLQELTSGQYHEEEKENKQLLMLGIEYSKIQSHTNSELI